MGASASFGRNVKRACWRRRAAGAAWKDKAPEGQNPRSATCLKMAGGWKEQEAAERLRKPGSGVVAGWVGSVGRFPAKPGSLTQ
jgi:hypothetical protein